jgi:hypothetical protein
MRQVCEPSPNVADTKTPFSADFEGWQSKLVTAALVGRFDHPTTFFA